LLQVTYLLVDSTVTLDNSPGIQSQTLDWFRRQRLSGIRMGMVADVQDNARFQKLAEPLLLEYQVPFATIPHRGLLRNIVSAAGALRQFHRRYPSHKVYVRSIWAAMAFQLAYPFGGPSLIYDFRGDIVAESQARGRRPIRQWILKHLTKWSVGRAQQVLCVSKPAACLLSLEYGQQQAVIIPSAVDYQRFSHARNHRSGLRKSMGLAESDLLLVYAGSASSYQLIPEMLRVWATLQDIPGVRFLLLLSQHPADVLSVIPEGLFAPGALDHRSVARDEVPMFLAASDVGFLLRKDHPLNHVAFPIKYAEYLAAGLAVVTSQGLGDVSQMVAERNLGILVSPDDYIAAGNECRSFLATVRADREGFQVRAQRAVVEEGLDWDSHLAIWKRVVSTDC
jgi:glycosyltransferase involved in cell wall biosynthesis